MTAKEMIGSVKHSIEAAGYRCADGLPEDMFLGLQSKGVVILAGSSDVEKERMARLFAGALGVSGENGRYLELEVRPDWLAPSDLLGRVNLEGVFLPGAIIDFLKRAQEDPEYPYFLCLEGVGLSSVEYYLKDIVTRLLGRGRGEPAKPLLPESYFREDAAAAKKYGTVCVPDNLYLIGTVHMDQASFPLNQRFLDSVHTIYVEPGDIIPAADGSREISGTPIKNDLLQPVYTGIVREGEHWESVQRYFQIFQQINRITVKARAYIEYTLRDEVVLYMLHNKHAGLLEEDRAMDLSIVRAVLPRLQGSSKMVMQALQGLFCYCVGDGCPNGDRGSGQMLAETEKGARYPKSARILAQMTAKCEKDDFTSLWL